MAAHCVECGEAAWGVLTRGRCDWCYEDAAYVKRISLRFNKEDHSETREGRESGEK